MRKLRICTIRNYIGVLEGGEGMQGRAPFKQFFDVLSRRRYSVEA